MLQKAIVENISRILIKVQTLAAIRPLWLSVGGSQCLEGRYGGRAVVPLGKEPAP